MVLILTILLPSAALAGGSVALVIVWHACRRLRQTTLVAPCAWALGAIAAVMGAVAVDDVCGAARAVHIEYLAAVSTLAPFVALLGAKRPQNRAWQWIVAALLLLLALHSLKAMVIDRGAPPEPHLAWRWFLAILLLAELTNYSPTKNAAPAVLVFAGQVCLLADYLPLRVWSFEHRPDWGLFLLAVGILLAAERARRRTASPATRAEVLSENKASLDRVWLDFRDAYGALWALRVADRMNTMARQQGWRIRLGWRGFRPIGRAESTIDPSSQQAAHRAFRAILSRFLQLERSITRRQSCKCSL